MSRVVWLLGLAIPLAWALPVHGEESAARAFGGFRSRVAVDTAFDSDPDAPFGENVLELRQWLDAGLDARLSERYRLYLEGRGRHRFVERRAPAGETFLVFNGQRKKASFEAELGEAWLAGYFAHVDVAFGRQVFAWGANPLLSPSDLLNALDLRESLLFADPADRKVPVLALSMRGELGPVELALVAAPFFEPNRFAVYGQDQGLGQPLLQRATSRVPARRIALPDPSMEDALQPLLLGTRRPQAFPSQAELGVRILSSALGPRLGASWLSVHERFPRLTLDADSAQTLAAVAGGQPVGAESGAALADILMKAPAFAGDFPRFQQLAAEASDLFGPVQVDLDLAWSPRRTYYDQSLGSLGLPTWTAVLGVSDARGTGLIASVSALVTLIQDVPAGQRLFLIEPAGSETGRHHAWVLVYAAVLGGRVLDDQLELEVRAFADGLLKSGAIGPRVGWRFNDWLTAGAGGEVYFGPSLFGFGYLRGNDSVFAEMRIRL